MIQLGATVASPFIRAARLVHVNVEHGTALLQRRGVLGTENATVPFASLSGLTFTGLKS